MSKRRPTRATVEFGVDISVEGNVYVVKGSGAGERHDPRGVASSAPGDEQPGRGRPGDLPDPPDGGGRIAGTGFFVLLDGLVSPATTCAGAARAAVLIPQGDAAHAARSSPGSRPGAPTSRCSK